MGEDQLIANDLHVDAYDHAALAAGPGDVKFEEAELFLDFIREHHLRPMSRGAARGRGDFEASPSLGWQRPLCHPVRSSRAPCTGPLPGGRLRAYEGKDPDDLVFADRHGFHLITPTIRQNSWWDRAVASIGEPGTTIHDLRHTAASLAVSAGANVKAVQRMLGRASAAMTLDTYSDLFDADLDDVAERLDSAARSAGFGTGPASSGTAPISIGQV